MGGPSTVGFAQRQILFQDNSIHGTVDKRKYTIEQNAATAIQALNLLQYSSEARTSSACIDKAMQFHMNYLHSGNYVWYTTHAYDALNNVFRGMLAADVNSELNFRVANAQLDNDPRFFDEIKNHYYTIWPINVELHWVAIILHVVPAPSPGRGRPQHIVNAVIADPERDPRTTGFVWSRLRRVLSPQRGFRFASDAPQPLWYPRQRDNYSCGLRAYEIMRALLARINEAELRAAPEGRWDGVWADLSCDFQHDKVRAEMIGIVAVEALRAQGWGARLVVAPCEEVGDGGHGGALVAAREPKGRLSHLPARAIVEYSPAVMALRREALGLAGPPTLEEAKGTAAVEFVLPRIPDLGGERKPHGGEVDPTGTVRSVLGKRKRGEGVSRKSRRTTRPVPDGPYKDNSENGIALADPITLPPNQFEQRILKAYPPSKRWEGLKAREEEEKPKGDEDETAEEEKIDSVQEEKAAAKKSSLRSADSKFRKLYTLG